MASAPSHPQKNGWWARICEKRAVAAWVICFPLLCAVAVWAATSMAWQAGLWSNLTMSEIFMQLVTSLEGANAGMVDDYLRRCVLPSAAALVLALAVALALPLGRWWRLIKAGTCLAFVLFCFILTHAVVSLDVSGFLQGSVESSDYIEAHYVDPRSVSLTFPERKRNLIYIWLESMESTYADTAHGGAFQRTSIPELVELAGENLCFAGDTGQVNGAFAPFGTTWTAGALFAHTCGLPLKIPVADSAMDQQEHFFTGVTAIGDILEEQGYNQALLIGSDATFGGRRNYFTQHGSYDILDYEYSRLTGQIPEDYKVWWGYEDEKLFAFAKEHLTRLAEEDKPFNLSILTVDTHFPDGYPCRLCTDEFGEDQYSNVMACSSRQVARFLDWLSQQPYCADTTVVLSGDHLTMDVDYCEQVSGDYPRRVYTVFLNPAAQPAMPDAYRQYTTFDLFPTTLAALGVDIPGDRLGLGVNLFSTRMTLMELDGLEEMNRELRKRSPLIDSLSGISQEVYDMSLSFRATHVELEADFEEEAIHFTLNGLGEIEDDFQDIELFCEKMYGERRSTLWYAPAQRQADGSYTITVEKQALNGTDPFTIHFYAMTHSGRIKVDEAYSCSVALEELTYLPEGP